MKKDDLFEMSVLLVRMRSPHKNIQLKGVCEIFCAIKRTTLVGRGLKNINYHTFIYVERGVCDQIIRIF